MSFDEFAAPALEGDGPRQAALLIHAMAVPDREWLWAKLSTQERASLQALLSELESLGIPSDRSILTEVLSSEPGKIAPPVAGDEPMEPQYPFSPIEPRLPSMSDEAFLAQLNAMDATVLASVLRPEPTSLVARLLQLRAWPWQDALLEKLGHSNRQKIQYLLQTPSGIATGKALSDALLRHVRLRYERAMYTASPGPSDGSVYNSTAPRSRQYGLRQWWQQLRGMAA